MIYLPLCKEIKIGIIIHVVKITKEIELQRENISEGCLSDPFETFPMIRRANDKIIINMDILWAQRISIIETLLVASKSVEDIDTSMVLDLINFFDSSEGSIDF